MVHESQSVGCKAISRCICFILTVFLISACAVAEEHSEQSIKSVEAEKKDSKSEIDPYEDFNRSMFKFNDHLDDYVAKPISDAYLWAAPGFFKQGVTNFFSNLKDINVFLNDHMQGKFEQGAEDTGRFLTNSTIGLLGLFDVATELGLKKHEEDFGQTLAVWGVPQGSYLVLPVLGPTTTRGVPGGIFDAAANPTSYVGMPVQLISMLNTRANAEGALKFIDEAAIDPYVFTREAYLQNQQHLISDGKSNGNVNVLPLEDDIYNEVDAAIAKDSENKKAASESKGEKKETNSLSETQVNNPVDPAVVNYDKALADMKNSTAKHTKTKKKHLKKVIDAPVN